MIDNIVEVDPDDYLSLGATSVHGGIISHNQIQYQVRLSRQIHTGNTFWDQLDNIGYDTFFSLVIK